MLVVESHCAEDLAEEIITRKGRVEQIEFAGATTLFPFTSEFGFAFCSFILLFLQYGGEMEEAGT